MFKRLFGTSKTLESQVLDQAIDAVVSIDENNNVIYKDNDIKFDIRSKFYKSSEELMDPKIQTFPNNLFASILKFSKFEFD